MSEQAQSRGSGFRTALWLSLALIAGMALCAWELWRREQAAAAQAKEQTAACEQRNAALEAEKRRLETLLREDPCVVARELERPASAFPVGRSAEPVSRNNREIP